MIAFWIGLPLALQLIIVTLAGLAGGAMANHMIYTWAYFPRPISPWAKAADEAPLRKPRDRVPIVGWLGLRREASIHGAGFWLRPILVEIGLAVGLPLLFLFETQWGGLLPDNFKIPNTLAAFEPWGTQIFLGHAILLVLMTAATFIDFDEQTIPDMITVPGTILALVLASCSVFWFMPASLPAGLAPTIFSLPWPADAKWSASTGLWTGLGIWSGWCFALADRRLILRKGPAKAVEFFFAGLVRYPTWKLLAVIWIAGIVGVCFVFSIGGTHWLGLLSSLVGLAIGGGIVWAIRIGAYYGLRTEAMGFGDVTLMAMIGAFLGWHAATIGFVFSPFAAIVIVVVQFIVTRQARIPFGPYLCAGTVLCIVFWARGYSQLALNVRLLGPMLLWLCLAMMGMMIIMLSVWRVIKRAIIERRS